MSVKFQMVLPDDLAIRLKQEASSREIPVAELIRQTMEEKLAATPKSRKRRPLDDIVGRIHTGDGNLAARVDEILYGKNVRRQ
ncbi:MAG: hypothetical protein ABI972_05500 [Acidobacteriota bacterium]